MDKNRIEITKEQALKMLGSQLLKHSCVYETSERIDFEDRGLVWSGRGTGWSEGIMLITPHHRDSEVSILIKHWENEENIPSDYIWKDNSSKVNNIQILDEGCTYLLDYKSYNGLTLILDRIIGDINKIGARREVYRFTFKIEHI